MTNAPGIALSLKSGETIVVFFKHVESFNGTINTLRTVSGAEHVLTDAAADELIGIWGLEGVAFDPDRG